MIELLEEKQNNNWKEIDKARKEISPKQVWWTGFIEGIACGIIGSVLFLMYWWAY